jgi:hypothetical protein
MPGSTRFNSEALPGSSTLPAKVDVVKLNGNTINLGAGNVDTGTLRVTLATDDVLAAVVKAEDAASANGDKGIVVHAVQKATPADTAGTDGDYAPLQMSGGRLHVSTQPATVSSATVSSLASSASSAQLLASNTSRKGLILVNTDVNSVYVKYGTTASATDFTVLMPANGYWEMPQPIYTGRIDAIWAADGAGSLYYTEL